MRAVLLLLLLSMALGAVSCGRDDYPAPAPNEGATAPAPASERDGRFTREGVELRLLPVAAQSDTSGFWVKDGVVLEVFVRLNGALLDGHGNVAWGGQGDTYDTQIDLIAGRASVPLRGRRVPPELMFRAPYLSPEHLPPPGSSERDEILRLAMADVESEWRRRGRVGRVDLLQHFDEDAAGSTELLLEIADSKRFNARERVRSVVWRVFSRRRAAVARSRPTQPAEVRRFFESVEVSRPQSDLAKELGVPVITHGEGGLPLVLMPPSVGLPDGSGEAVRSRYITMREVTHADVAGRHAVHAARRYLGRRVDYGDLPVCGITLSEAREVARALSREDSRFRYRLPTWSELSGLAELARGGAASGRELEARLQGMENLADEGALKFWATGVVERFEELVDAQAWAWDDLSPSVAPAASYLPNALGLFDLHGNVSEWCGDRGRGDAAGGLIWGGNWLSGREYNPAKPARLTLPKGSSSPLVGLRLIAEELSGR